MNRPQGSPVATNESWSAIWYLMHIERPWIWKKCVNCQKGAWLRSAEFSGRRTTTWSGLFFTFVRGFRCPWLSSLGMTWDGAHPRNFNRWAAAKGVTSWLPTGSASQLDSQSKNPWWSAEVRGRDKIKPHTSPKEKHWNWDCLTLPCKKTWTQKFYGLNLEIWYVQLSPQVAIRVIKMHKKHIFISVSRHKASGQERLHQ